MPVKRADVDPGCAVVSHSRVAALLLAVRTHLHTSADLYFRNLFVERSEPLEKM